MIDKIRKSIANLVIPRLNGEFVQAEFDRYLSFVRSGFGGFIVFGGEKDTLKEALKELEQAAGRRLLILSDLEQGLGQQVAGGSLLPPAMAVSHAIDPENYKDVKIFRKSVEIIAREAQAVGINVILAPVADIHTNPANPIICTRAYGSDSVKVSWFVKEYINVLQGGGAEPTGLLGCVKHFPGHGDTDLDSHLSLPMVSADLERLYSVELAPFRSAISAGIKMVMVGHLLVKAVDPLFSVTLSSKAIHGLLREKLGFDGVVITDAMNMGAVKDTYGEASACLMALMAGCDILLHPDDPEVVVDFIAANWSKAEERVKKAGKRVESFREKLRLVNKQPLSSASPLTGPLEDGIVNVLSRKSLRVRKGTPCLRGNEALFVIDEDDKQSLSSGQGSVFIGRIKQKYPGVGLQRNPNSFFSKDISGRQHDRPVIVALFSRIAAWKGKSGLSEDNMRLLMRILSVFSKTTVISFGSPYLLEGIEADTLINAWWSGEAAQVEVAELLMSQNDIKKGFWQ